MIKNDIVYALIKTSLDAHTLGLNAAECLLEECGCKVIVAPKYIEEAVCRLETEEYQKKILDWLIYNNVNCVGFSYRLDPNNAVNIFGKLVYLLKKKKLAFSTGARISFIFFAGLPKACDVIEKEYNGSISVFKGGENAVESLLKMGVEVSRIPQKVYENSKYDDELMAFGNEVINSGYYLAEKPLERINYKEFGTAKDNLIKRLKYNFVGGFQPLIRAHSGPYSAEKNDKEIIKEYGIWCKNLADSGYLDILSIGSSQLSQSNFGEDWFGMPNGGGVPVNSEKDFIDIWNNSRPMLVRTYSGTKNVLKMAKTYEDTINMSWHALSLWWFNELDGRGPNDLWTNLFEHIETIKYIASVNKPFEANVSHHFAFRGSDDVTYIVSAYIAAKLAKKCGIKYFILQNMLNTPRTTWGIQDLAKSRAMLSLIKSLEDKNFKVILQTRAGLDFFKPNIEDSKRQLAAVTALIDDIDPNNIYSPDIIHVVSYCEALYLATPEIIDESIKITRYALKEYRKKRKLGLTSNVFTDGINARFTELKNSAEILIRVMEKYIPDLYSVNGLYLAFLAGWLPTPYLWNNSEKFKMAKSWQTKLINGGVFLVEGDLIQTLEHRINKCLCNMEKMKCIGVC